MNAPQVWLAATGPTVDLPQRVAAALAELGDTADLVAATLSNAGMAGWPGSPLMDPVCRWLAQMTPEAHVLLYPPVVRVWTGDGDGLVEVPLPPAVAAYAAYAAGGRYPDLILGVRVGARTWAGWWASPPPVETPAGVVAPAGETTGGLVPPPVVSGAVPPDPGDAWVTAPLPVGPVGSGPDRETRAGDTAELPAARDAIRVTSGDAT